MPAAMRRETPRAWTIPGTHRRDLSMTRNVHAVQMAGLDQRVRHKATMVRWLEALAQSLVVLAVASMVAGACGMGAVLMGLYSGEANVSGFLVFVLGLLFAACCLATRHLLRGGKQSLCADIHEAVVERNRLQYLR